MLLLDFCEIIHGERRLGKWVKVIVKGMIKANTSGSFARQMYDLFYKFLNIFCKIEKKKKNFGQILWGVLDCV